MKINTTALRSMFIALGFASASKWDTERLNTKLQKLTTIIDDPDEVDPKTIKDPEARALFDKIAAATKKKDAIVLEDEASEEPEEKPSKKPSKKSEPAPEADEDEGEAEADEDDAEEPEAKPAKKSDAKPSKKSEPKSEEKPAKKPAPKADTTEKDKWGARMGSSRQLINSAVMTASKKNPKTTDAIVEETGVGKATVQEHLWKLRAVDKKIDRNESGWFLLK